MNEKLKSKVKYIILFIVAVVIVGIVTNVYNFFLIGWNLKVKDAYVECEKCGETYKVDRIEDNIIYIYSCNEEG